MTELDDQLLQVERAIYRLEGFFLTYSRSIGLDDPYAMLTRDLATQPPPLHVDSVLLHATTAIPHKDRLFSASSTTSPHSSLLS